MLFLTFCRSWRLFHEPLRIRLAVKNCSIFGRRSPPARAVLLQKCRHPSLQDLLMLVGCISRARPTVADAVHTAFPVVLSTSHFTTKTMRAEFMVLSDFHTCLVFVSKQFQSDTVQYKQCVCWRAVFDFVQPKKHGWLLNGARTSSKKKTSLTFYKRDIISSCSSSSSRNYGMYTPTDNTTKPETTLRSVIWPVDFRKSKFC